MSLVWKSIELLPLRALDYVLFLGDADSSMAKRVGKGKSIATPFGMRNYVRVCPIRKMVCGRS